MVGAHEYAKMFPSGQYGYLRIYSGEHARGKYFHIYIGRKENEVEVYGILGGHPGWTEWYGWIHEGPWQQDFEKEIEKRKAELTAEFERSRQYKARTIQNESDRVKSVLRQYEERASCAKESSAPENTSEARLTDS
jgi:hypothetical protein